MSLPSFFLLSHISVLTLVPLTLVDSVLRLGRQSKNLGQAGFYHWTRQFTCWLEMGAQAKGRKTCQDLSEGSQGGYHLSGKKTKARLVLNEGCVWPTSLSALIELFWIPLVLLISATKFLTVKRYLLGELLQWEDVRSSTKVDPPYPLGLEFFSVIFGSNILIIHVDQVMSATFS